MGCFEEGLSKKVGINLTKRPLEVEVQTLVTEGIWHLGRDPRNDRKGNTGEENCRTRRENIKPLKAGVCRD